MKTVYLDSAATSNYGEFDDIIVDTINRAMRDYWMNPSSLYATDVKEKIDKCRINIAKFISAESNEIFFTSGASESNNWAIRGWTDMYYQSTDKPIIISTPIEHKSIKNLLDSNLMRSIATVAYCNVDEYGLIKYESLEYLLDYYKHKPILVSIGMANSEIGTSQHIQMISKLIHKNNGVLHVDATQALPHIPINVKELGIDILSASGHKLSPILKGIGFLYKNENIKINPLIYGAQENGLRGGTENVFGIIGLSKAIDYCDVSDESIERMTNKRNYFISQLENKFDCKLNGHHDYRLPNNINVTFPQNITGESLLYILDTSMIKIGVGSACNSHTIKPSYVLKTIGLTDDEAMRTIRISLSEETTYTEIDIVINEIEKAIKLIEIN